MNNWFLFPLSKLETGISNFSSYSRKFLFLLSKNMNLWFLFLLSKPETRISHFSFYSQNSRSESCISLSTLEIRDQNFKFLFLLSKFEIRISNFSFYSRIYFFDSRQCLAWSINIYFYFCNATTLTFCRKKLCDSTKSYTALCSKEGLVTCNVKKKHIFWCPEVGLQN